MSKKHYERAANIVQHYANDKQLMMEIREAFVWLFDENPRFDTDKFRAACKAEDQTS